MSLVYLQSGKDKWLNEEEHVNVLPPTLGLCEGEFLEHLHIIF